MHAKYHKRDNICLTFTQVESWNHYTEEWEIGLFFLLCFQKNVSFNSNLGHPAKDSHLMHIWSIRIKKKLQNKKLWFF